MAGGPGSPILTGLAVLWALTPAVPLSTQRPAVGTCRRMDGIDRELGGWHPPTHPPLAPPPHTPSPALGLLTGAAAGALHAGLTAQLVVPVEDVGPEDGLLEAELGVPLNVYPPFQDLCTGGKELPSAWGGRPHGDTRPHTATWSPHPETKRGCRKCGEGMYGGCRDRTMGDDFKLKEGRFRLDSGKKFIAMRAQSSCGCPIPGGAQAQGGGHRAVGGVPATWSGDGWDLGHSNPNHAVILYPGPTHGAAASTHGPPTHLPAPPLRPLPVSCRMPSCRSPTLPSTANA